MKRFVLNTFGFATAVVALSGLAVAQDQAQGLKLMSGNTELVHGLSTKSATEGEAVTVKLTDTIKTPEGVSLPRGTELLGHVNQVKASNGKGPSALVLTFNQARLKDGKVLAIKATLVGLAPQDGTQRLPVAIAPDESFYQEAGAISGVTLRSAAREMASGTLTDDHRDINLKPGTQFLVGVGVESAQATAAAE